MIPFFGKLMAAVVSAEIEASAGRAAVRAQAYTGPLRRRDDAIDVEARVVDDVAALPAPEETAP